VRIADDGGFRHLRVRDQRALDLRRAETVAGDVDDVVDAAGDPVVAISIAAAAIAGEVLVPGYVEKYVWMNRSWSP
jgi:hypothetical protein